MTTCNFSYLLLKNMAALAKTMTLLLVAMALHGVFLGAVYNVGDSAGWTIGHVDYQTWVSSKNFIVGDSLGIYLIYFYLLDFFFSK